MLHFLSVSDLVLIARAEIELGAGLTVLTGETGAGKSILLDGLGLVLGDRADASMVRAGAREAQVTAGFRLSPAHPAFALLAEQGLAPAEADGSLLLRRQVRADGGSRAFVDDRPVSAGLLRALGGLLVEIHGQHDERGLLAPRGHRALLDAFAGLAGEVAAVAEAHAEVAAAGARLDGARAMLASAESDRDWLDHAVAEIAALAPRPGEEAELADLRQRMKAGERHAQALGQVEELVSASEGALALLRQAARRLERMTEAAPELAAALEAADRALVEGDAIEAALASARARFDVSPEVLEQAEARLFELRALARKHRVEVDALPALAETLAARLGEIEGGAGAVAAAERELADAERRYAALAGALSAARRAAAERLDRDVNAELPHLKLDAARFRTRIDAAPPSAAGIDAVMFEVATNRGAEFGPLTRIASGGELSRFVLALKVALATSGTAATLVFDEIDRGVGGATASAIGARLARVAGGAQVLVVTHSPQVAAAGQWHLRISKEDREAGAQTLVAPLTPAERTEEVARMLSGAEVTGEARAQAARLLQRAASA
jgi:DNA repair protein RecN (Recombination protein N)